MKKRIIALMAAILVTWTPLSAQAATWPFDSNGNWIGITEGWYICGSNVHLRTAPGTGNLSLGLLDNGDRFNAGALTAFTVNGYYWRNCKMTTGRNSGKSGHVASVYTKYGPV